MLLGPAESWQENSESASLLYLPSYLALLSAVSFALRPLWTSWKSKRPSYDGVDTEDPCDESPNTRPDVPPTPNTTDDYVRRVLNRARLAGNIVLLALSTVTIWQELRTSTTAKHARHLLVSTPRFYLWLSFVYTSVLAYATLTRPAARLAGRNANLILLSVLLVYSYRNIWPLATYDLTPLDVEAEGVMVVWTKIATLFITAVLIPACIPRRYVPVDPKCPMPEPNPKHTASWLSRVTFAFLDPLLWKAYRQETHLRHDQLPPLADSWEAKYQARQAAKFIHPSHTKGRSIAWGLLRYFWRDYVWMAVSIVCSSTLSFAAPTATKNILRYLEIGPSASPIRPWFWLLLLFIGPIIKGIFIAWFFSLGTTVRVHVECLVTELVYEHALRMRLQGVNKDNKATGKGSSAGNQTGRIHTLVTSDLLNIVGVVDILNFVIQIPMMTTFSIIFLYQILGWSALVGAASIVIFVPIPGWIGKKIKDAQTRRMKETDGRVQAISEAVSVMRMIKLFGWEKNMIGRIEEKRDRELSYLWKIMVLKIINNVVGMLITSSTIFITYAVYTAVMKEELNASKIFSTMAVFNMLRAQIERVSWRMTLVIQAKVSFDRLDDFLTNTPLLDSSSHPRDGLPNPYVDEPQDASQQSIGFKDVMFSWSPTKALSDSSPDDFRLRIDGELKFVPHGINIISGPTGSGKTSMLLALLSEMHLTRLGQDSWCSLPRAGGVAYAAQESWVQNATVKENILFGSAYDEERYRKVVYQCALENDIASFDGGHNAEVGERGITLSGGQKMRLTLARAIYSPAEILLLDDIFASLDAHTSSWILNLCLNGELLENRTVVLATHNVPLVADVADLVVTVGPDGTVGAHSQSANTQPKRTRVSPPEAVSSRSTPEVDVKPTEASTLVAPSLSDAQGKLVTAEHIAEGRILLKSMKLFLGALGGRHSVLLLVSWLGAVTFSRLVLILRVWFLGFWGSQYETHDPFDVPVNRYLQGFLSILLLGVLSTAATQIFYNARVIKAVRNIHAQLVSSVFTSTLRWLDETPGGRIIARCTQDIRSVDEPIPNSTSEALDAILTVVTKIAAIVLFVPVFAVPAVVVSIAGLFVGSIYLRSQLAIKREMSNARSPVLAHVNETIHGLMSIRAYNAVPAFVKESMSRIDYFSRAAHACWNLNRWIGIRIDFLGAAFTATLATYLVYGGSVGAANSGFTLNMALEFCTYLFLLIRISNDLEVECNSLERIQGFLDIEHEAEPSPDNKVPAAWPTSGDLRVSNLSARYSKGGPTVLRDISFEIASGERIGIVGRTGSGKSSLALALLRCIIAEGDIFLDGIETKSVNLDVLRSNITIIPQAPELISGTLRHNLDPFDERDDATLLEALQSSGFFSLNRQKNDLAEARSSLDTHVTGAGANFSVGERQIIALARAMIRRSRVLILDEATSAIDHQTDNLIQENLRRQAASDVTVITIAHRLQSVMDADKIMVLDSGRVVEFDTPASLLSQNGAFKSLVDENLRKADSR